MWKPNHGTIKRGNPTVTFVDQLRRETGLSTEELKNIMDEQELWRILVNDVQVCSKYVKQVKLLCTEVGSHLSRIFYFVYHQ